MSYNCIMDYQRSISLKLDRMKNNLSISDVNKTYVEKTVKYDIA